MPDWVLPMLVAPLAVGIVVAIFKIYYENRMREAAAFKEELNAVIKKLSQDIADLNLKTSVLNVQMAPYRRLQSELANELHHPDPNYARSDYLLEQLNSDPPKITVPERDELKEYLKTTASNRSDTGSARSTASALLAIMPRVIEEAKEIAKKLQTAAAEDVKAKSLKEVPAR